ncbi:MAG: imidazole glycerol phosphate synthase subunit HisH, partial [Proteobacteria bacterium]|nr:imidazole glycerol phosphate synthase subunit HisH [Pseudomonadota bacterium]
MEKKSVPWLIGGKYGNRGSLLNMLTKCGATNVLEGRTYDKAVSHLILSGVGSFDEGLRHLDESNLRDELMETLQNRRTPILGICLGAQMLGESSDEGKRSGLGWINARSTHLKSQGLEMVPHVGWQQLTILKEDPLFKGLAPDARFYFTHSYGMVDVPADQKLAVPSKGPSFAAVVRKGNA